MSTPFHPYRGLLMGTPGLRADRELDLEVARFVVAADKERRRFGGRLCAVELAFARLRLKMIIAVAGRPGLATAQYFVVCLN